MHTSLKQYLHLKCNENGCLKNNANLFLHLSQIPIFLDVQKHLFLIYFTLFYVTVGFFLIYESAWFAVVQRCVTYETITTLCGGLRDKRLWFQQTDSAALEGTTVFPWL